MGKKKMERKNYSGEPPRDAPEGWLSRFPLPADTAQALKNDRIQCENLGLWLDRFLDWTDQEEQKRRGQTEYKSVPLQVVRETKKRKAPILENGGLQKIENLIQACNERIKKQIESYKRSGYHVCEPLICSPHYRLAIGFGAEHVLETNLYLHRIYGFPIIPGSAVKGVTRAWAFWQIAEQLGILAIDADERERRERAENMTPLEKKTPLQKLDQLLSEGEEKARLRVFETLKSDPCCSNIQQLQSLDLTHWLKTQNVNDFYLIFGTTTERGKVVFFDAYPTQAPKLQLDILNPHYGDYYQKKEKNGKPIPPADYLEPKPTYFLTVESGSEFQFAVASKDPALAAKAEEWLKNALSQLGIGGKTSAGYGFME